MTPEEIRAILTISLLAAYADSHKHEREREEIRRIAEGLAQSEEVNLPSLYQDVLLKRTNLATAAAALTSAESRELAYEMAVCVCDADGETSAAERAFLQSLRAALKLDEVFAQQAHELSEAMAAVTLQTQAPPVATAPEPVRAPELLSAQSVGEVVPHPAFEAPVEARTRLVSTLSREEMDRKILNAAIANGAIELLPESLSTMAIIPLQMRLVYQIGQSYGFELDKGHIRDFLATVGVGMTSQYLEQAGRKLLGGLLGKKLGKSIFGSAGKQAVSSGMSFAATYALGHVANQYYAGGRTLSTQMLKDAYSHVLQDGRALHAQYLPAMRDQAGKLDGARIMAMVSGKTAAF